jgi:hypothetical protein
MFTHLRLRQDRTYRRYSFPIYKHSHYYTVASLYKSDCFIMLEFVHTALSYLVVMCVIYYCQQPSAKLEVEFFNNGDSGHAVSLCWTNSYTKDAEVIALAPSGCSYIGFGESSRMISYAGHRFLVLPYDKSVDDTFNTIVIDPQITSYIIEKFNPDESVGKYFRRVVVENRDAIIVGMCCVYVAYLQIRTSKSLSNNEHKTARNEHDETTLAISRHSLKCFAVIIMVLNHVSHLFMSGMAKEMGVLPADLGGSSHIFSFLVGYNTSPHSARVNNTILIGVFVFLEYVVRLPKPFTFEQIVSYVVAREVLSCRVFASDNSPSPSCSFTKLPIVIHAIVISTLAATNSVTNADGLRVWQNSSLLYAFAGRMFALRAPLPTRLLWAVSCTAFVLHLNWRLKYDVYDTTDIMGSCVLGACVCGILLQTALFAFPVSKQLWEPSNVAKTVSRYSLEIYVVHLLAFYLYYKMAQ